jgi:probable phosphoglycerate mutase
MSWTPGPAHRPDARPAIARTAPAERPAASARLVRVTRSDDNDGLEGRRAQIASRAPDKTMTELILIRHGETDWNLQHRFQGQIDVPLNARGLAQAQRLGVRLAAEAIDAFACSDLQRARQTASPAAERLRLVPDPVPGLREQGFGVLEGLALHEIIERHPLEWEQWRRHDPDYALPGGENVRSFHARVVAAVLALGARHPRRRIAVVTHGGALDMVYRTALGLPLHGPRTCPIPNAGINLLRVSGDSIEIVEWADDAHVADLGAVTPANLADVAPPDIQADGPP